MKTKKEEGYRLLKVGERLRPTDEVWEWGFGPWKPFNTPLKRGERRQPYHAPIRRRKETPKAVGRSRPSPKSPREQERKTP